MTQIAKEAGVSVAVVSRLLRGDPTLRVSDARRRQILDAKARLGEVKARRRKRRLTQIILVPVNRDFSQEWVMTSLAGSEYLLSLEAELRQHGFRFHFTFFETAKRRAFYQSLIFDPGSCDGLLLLSGEAEPWLAELLRTHDFPHVSADYRAEQHHVNTVRAHAAEGLRQAVEHLKALGHREIGFLGPRETYRYPLTAAAILGAGLSHEPTQLCHVEPLGHAQGLDAWAGHAELAVARWLDEGARATALICANDWIAHGAVRAIRARGLTLGRDLSVVGHDNLERRAGLDLGGGEPILTTIDNPTDLIGRRAAQLLVNQVMHGQRQIVHERIPAPLIVRSTTGPRPASAPSTS